MLSGARGCVGRIGQATGLIDDVTETSVRGDLDAVCSSLCRHVPGECRRNRHVACAVGRRCQRWLAAAAVKRLSVTSPVLGPLVDAAETVIFELPAEAAPVLPMSACWYRRRHRIDAEAGGGSGRVAAGGQRHRVGVAQH